MTTEPSNHLTRQEIAEFRAAARRRDQIRAQNLKAVRSELLHHRPIIPPPPDWEITDDGLIGIPRDRTETVIADTPVFFDAVLGHNLRQGKSPEW